MPVKLHMHAPNLPGTCMQGVHTVCVHEPLTYVGRVTMGQKSSLHLVFKAGHLSGFSLTLYM